MFRRYNRWWATFDQPDPYDGSYNLADPQSFNRYAYVQNDSVNSVDPSGLLTVPPGGFGNVWVVDSLPPEDPFLDSFFTGSNTGPAFIGLGGGGRESRGGAVGGRSPGGVRDPQKPKPGTYSVDSCIDKAYKDFRNAWNAAGLNLTGKAWTGITAAAPHLDDLIPLGLTAVVGWLARESFGPISAGVSNMYAPGKRLYNVTVAQNRKEAELEKTYLDAVRACQANGSK